VKVEHNAHSRRLDEEQAIAVEQSIKALKYKGRALLQMPTGCGKTITAAKVIKHFSRHKVLWISQREELLKQTQYNLSVFLKESVGLYRRDEKSLEERVIVASIQTLSKKENLESIPKDFFDLVIVDECHHAAAQTWSVCIERFHLAKVFGITATPFRSDDLTLSQFFGEICYSISFEESVEKKLIAEPVYRLVLTNSQLNGLKVRGRDYSPSQLEKRIISVERQNIIVDSYLKHGRKFMDKRGLPRKAVCFCVTVDHAIRMAEVFNERGVRAEYLVGKIGQHSSVSAKEQIRLTESQRRVIYDTFKDTEEIEVLTVCAVLDEGADLPLLSCAMMAAPTLSPIRFAQRLGRCTRRIEGRKTEFLVLDYIDLIDPKMPPTSFSKMVQKDYESHQFDRAYYRGDDPLIVDKLIEYLSYNYTYVPPREWTKKEVVEALLAFYKEHGELRKRHLVYGKTGLPSRTVIERYWKSVEACFRELKIPLVVDRRRWTKDQASKAILGFYRKHGSIRILQLGSANKLPSIKAVNSIWGSYFACLEDLGIGRGWTSESCLTAIREFYIKHGHYPMQKHYEARHGLPALKTLKRFFKNPTHAIQQIAA
jgi:superfamily II DNA or RNA helicase